MASRESHLKSRYGITLEDYARMLHRQHYACAICLTPAIEGRNLDVDHCHVNGHVRGLLCRSCNLALGKLFDSPEVARRVATYLNTPPEKL